MRLLFILLLYFLSVVSIGKIAWAFIFFSNVSKIQRLALSSSVHSQRQKQAIHLAAADAYGSRSNMGLIWQMQWQLPRHETAAALLFA